MNRLIVGLILLTAACGARPAPVNDRDETTEQAWTNVAPSAIGPTTCITPFNPMYQAWPSSGWCETVPWSNVNSLNSPWWRVSSCMPNDVLPRATAEITLSNGQCARLWGAVNPNGTYFDFDIVGAFGWRSDAVGYNQAAQIVAFRMAHDTFLSFCTGPMSLGNPCQPANPPNFPEWGYGTESNQEASGGFNPLFKPASIHLATW